MNWNNVRWKFSCLGTADKEFCIRDWGESHKDSLSPPGLVGLCWSAPSQTVSTCDDKCKDKIHLHVQEELKASWWKRDEKTWCGSCRAKPEKVFLVLLPTDAKWPQGRHIWELVSLMLNQFSSVKIKPGCFQLAWENQDSHHGPHSCILELYKHRPGRKCLLLASLCYNRKCCCFLYLSCSQSLHGKHCLPWGFRMRRTCSILWPVPTSWSRGSVPLKTLPKLIWKWAELCNAMAEKLLVRN